MKKNRRSKNKRDWYYNGKIAGGYSLNRNPRGVLFEPVENMEIIDAAKAAYHLALHHKIDVVMNFNGVKLNVTCQNGAKPENIAKKYYKFCHKKTKETKMFNLKDKVVLITGATGGIGGEIAKQMKNAGATVVVSGRGIDKLNSEFDDGFIKIASDLSTDGATEKLIADTIERTGRIDVLINNAGITADTLMMRMSDEQFDNVINVNLRATFKLCRAVLMPMMKQRFGRIINMASIIGTIGGPGQANYAASKGGMIAMTKSIAAEVASRGITANCIAPGFIKTPMTDVLPDELKKTYLSQIPAGRFGEPIDIANTCVFLASDEASYINGQTIHVNGGIGRF